MRPRHLPRVDVRIRDAEQDGEVAFVLSFYGLQVGEFLKIPGGSAPIKAALRRRGMSPHRYFSTIWDVEQRQ